MQITLIPSIIGVFSFDDNGTVVEKILFKKDPHSVAEKLEEIKTGKVIPELISMVKRLENDYDILIFEDASIASAIEETSKIKARVVHPSPHGENLRQNITQIAVQVGFMAEPELVRKFIQEVSIELTRLRVKKAGEKRDLMVVQSILSIDDLDKTINLFMGRIREWYGLHFPELDKLIEKHKNYADLVASLGGRSNFTKKNLSQLGLQEKTIDKVIEATQDSIGAELTEDDIQQIQTLSKQVCEMYNLRESLQNYADSIIIEVAPNTKALVGALLAARLIALAGGLENLAKMPASTIQVLGAEKALFRALKTGSRPPKHGVIFQDTVVHDSKKWQRGKASRALAGKLAIAARSDAFTNRYIGDKLKADLKKRIDEIKDKYQEPPKRKSRRSEKSLRKKRRKKRGRKH
jgi:nucleolar protein 56